MCHTNFDVCMPRNSDYKAIPVVQVKEDTSEPIGEKFTILVLAYRS